MNAALQDSMLLAPCALAEERRERRDALDWPAVAVAALNWAALVAAAFAITAASAVVLFG